MQFDPLLEPDVQLAKARACAWPWLTIDEVAATLNCSVRTVRRWQATGDAPMRRKWGRRYVYSLADVAQRVRRS